MKCRVSLCLAGILVPGVLATGCGGNGNGGGGFLAHVLGAKVTYPSRSATTPSGLPVKSIVLTFAANTPGGTQNVQWVVNRDPGPDGQFTQSYKLPLPAGLNATSGTLIAAVCGQPDGLPPLVLKAPGSAITLDSQGNASAGLNTAATSADVKTVEVPAQTIKVGATADIQFTAKDATGNIVSVPPNTASSTPGATATETDGGQLVAINNAPAPASTPKMTGSAAGTATVQVTVNGVSGTGTVTVTP